MSTNVIPLFGKPKTVEEEVKSTGLVKIISEIVEWADNQGLDISNDTGLELRITDLVVYMRNREMEQRLSA